ncbi:hypothetical protein OQA88_4238 [Cercophora sp. LCS_1]
MAFGGAVRGILGRRDGPKSNARLDSLPAEINAAIYGHLTPDSLPFDSVTPRLQELSRRQDKTKWEGRYFEQLSLLRDLRLVSRGVCHAVTPFFLKSVIISSAREFVLFLRFLLQSPQYGVYLRHLAIFVTLNNELVSERVVNHISKGLASGTFLRRLHVTGPDEPIEHFVRGFRHMGGEFTDGRGFGQWDATDVTEFALFCLLRAAPNLDQLALQVPIRLEIRRRAAAGTQSREKRDPWSTLHQHIRAEESSPPASQLRKLQLRPDPKEHVLREKQHRRHEIGGFGNSDILNYRLGHHRLLLEAFPSLSTLQLASCGEVSLIGAVEEGRVHRNVEHIHLHNTSEGPFAIAYLLSPEVTPRLKSLHVRQRPKQLFTDDMVHSTDRDKEGKEDNLDLVLATRADSLRELHLIFDYTWEYNCFIGPGRRLTCLPDLVRLRKLTIQLQLLFGNPKRIYQKPEPCLARMLPPNLVELTIRDDWAIDSIAREQRRRSQLGYHMRVQIQAVEGAFPNTVQDDDDYFCTFEKHEPYRTAIQTMLLQLASTARYDGLPDLRAVTFQVLPSKVYRTDGRTDGSVSSRDPALQPMEEDLFRDPRRGFFTDPPRWVPLLGKDMWPREHWELMNGINPFFENVRAAFEEAGIAFDWVGDARVWLDALKVAADADDGRKEESAVLERGKEEDEVDEDELVGGAAVKRKRLARLVGRTRERVRRSWGKGTNSARRLREE